MVEDEAKSYRLPKKHHLFQDGAFYDKDKSAIAEIQSLKLFALPAEAFAKEGDGLKYFEVV